MIHRRLLFFILILAAISAFSSVPQLVRAEPDVITDSQIKKIRSQCTELQATIAQLHANDRVIRLDRGNLYLTISGKMMVPFNQRLASNQLDGSELVALTATFNDTYETFTDEYREYDTSLTNLSNINCAQKPSQFYSALKTARADRQKLAKTVNSLNDQAGKYRSLVDDFRNEMRKNNATE